MQKIGGATITSGATISIEGATISISHKAKRRNHILGGATIFFGGATMAMPRNANDQWRNHN
jgi:hypothetical protein